MKRTWLAMAALMITSHASAQEISVERCERSAHIWLFGSDGTFQDGRAFHDSNSDPGTEWSGQLDGELGDESHELVARGESYHESTLSPTSIVFALDASTHTTGQHEFANASVLQVHQVEFQLLDRARIDLRALVQLSGGIGHAAIRLFDSEDNELLAIHAAPGGNGNALESTDLEPGRYVLDALLDVNAIGTDGSRRATNGSVECEFVVLPQDDQLSGGALPGVPSGEHTTGPTTHWNGKD